jgi:hypothetical protein
MKNESVTKLRMTLTVFLACLVLSGCSGGGSATAAPAAINPATTVINGVVVPPDPGTQARASLVGVDTNTNGVRDEVERGLAIYSGTTKVEFDAAMKAAAEAQSWLTKGILTEQEAQQLVLKEIQLAQCLLSSTTPDRARAIAEQIELRTFDTKLRRSERQKILEQGGTFELPSMGAASC